MIIKFRGWSKYGKEWLYGYYLSEEKKYSYIIPSARTEFVREFSNYEIVPESLGMFTGKRDCKRTKEFPEGQEIYGAVGEKGGDICICNPNVGRTLVDWKDDEGGWVWRIRMGEKPFWSWHWVKEVEIIGNTFENGELLVRK